MKGFGRKDPSAASVTKRYVTLEPFTSCLQIYTALVNLFSLHCIVKLVRLNRTLLRLLTAAVWNQKQPPAPVHRQWEHKPIQPNP